MGIIKSILIIVFIISLAIALFGIRYWEDGSQPDTIPIEESAEATAPEIDLAKAEIPELMDALMMYTTKEPLDAPVFELDSLGGDTVRLDQYRSHVVLLNFWATW